MFRIRCPHCGERSFTEFAYREEVRERPAFGTDIGVEAWIDYVYYRDNPRGRHREYWQHVGGCRAWLVVERDTATHEVHEAVAVAIDERVSDVA